jgi:hypothetical protein
MTAPVTLQCPFHVALQEKGHKKLSAEPVPAAPQVRGRVPRIARLLALALRFEEMLTAGQVSDYAELAHLGQVSRARISQIMNLLLLATDIQEAILLLPRVTRGRDPIHLRQLQPIALVPDWSEQRRLWRKLRGDGSPEGPAGAENC